MMASLYHKPSPSASVTRLVASMEDSKFMRPSRFPAKDDWTVREEGEVRHAHGCRPLRGQNRGKSAWGEGAPEGLSGFVHGDATDKKLTFRRTSVLVLAF